MAQQMNELQPIFQDVWLAVKPFHPGTLTDFEGLWEALKEVSQKYPNNKHLTNILYEIYDYYGEAQNDKKD